jgi:hypothetical protein
MRKWQKAVKILKHLNRWVNHNGEKDKIHDFF